MGTFFGIHRWPGSNRTLEGTGAMYLALLVGMLVVEQAEKQPFMVLGAKQVRRGSGLLT